MRVSGCLWGVAAIVIAGLSQIWPVSPVTGTHAIAVRLINGTSIPQPSQLYLEAADALYLQPRGFGGTLQSLFTPEDIRLTELIQAFSSMA